MAAVSGRQLGSPVPVQTGVSASAFDRLKTSRPMLLLPLGAKTPHHWSGTGVVVAGTLEQVLPGPMRMAVPPSNKVLPAAGGVPVVPLAPPAGEVVPPLPGTTIMPPEPPLAVAALPPVAVPTAPPAAPGLPPEPGADASG